MLSGQSDLPDPDCSSQQVYPRLPQYDICRLRVLPGHLFPLTQNPNLLMHFLSENHVCTMRHASVTPRFMRMFTVRLGQRVCFQGRRSVGKSGGTIGGKRREAADGSGSTMGVWGRYNPPPAPPPYAPGVKLAFNPN